MSSQLMVQLKSSDTQGVIGPTGRSARAMARVRPVLDSSILGLYPGRSGDMFSSAWLPGGFARNIKDIDHDVLNVHWTAAGFLAIEEAGRQEKPLVWTLHDMWLFTGGCHYSGGCLGYLESCGKCPQLGSGRATDLSRVVWKRKARSWGDLALAVVSPTNWLAEAARRSSLLKDATIHVIPNGVDTRQFQPFDRSLSREALGLQQDKVLLAFGAFTTSQPRKGRVLLLEALRKLGPRIDPTAVEFVVFGAGHLAQNAEIPIATKYVGRLYDDVSLALLYSAVDLVVVPSLYEAHSLVAVESMACGTPCVAFRVEGLSEVIDDRENGLLARPFDTDDLADKIAEMATNNAFRARAAIKARAKALKVWDIDLVARQYEALFDSVD